MYQPYADYEVYSQMNTGITVSEDDIYKYLKEASRDIDALTYHRILKKGFENLTEFQKEIIQEVCCDHASFLLENEQMLKTFLNSYSINGVSMTFGESWNIYIEDGVAMEKRLYEKLCSTGLCCRSFYYG